jgi:hypothetical protein
LHLPQLEIALGQFLRNRKTKRRGEAEGRKERLPAGGGRGSQRHLDVFGRG